MAPQKGDLGSGTCEGLQGSSRAVLTSVPAGWVCPQNTRGRAGVLMLCGHVTGAEAAAPLNSSIPACHTRTPVKTRDDEGGSTCSSPLTGHPLHPPPSWRPAVELHTQFPVFSSCVAMEPLPDQQAVRKSRVFFKGRVVSGCHQSGITSTTRKSHRAHRTVTFLALIGGPRSQGDGSLHGETGRPEAESRSHSGLAQALAQASQLNVRRASRAP